MAWLAGAVSAAEGAAGGQVRAALWLLTQDEDGDGDPGGGRVLRRADLLRAVRAALAVVPLAVHTASGVLTDAEAISFQAGQAAAVAAVRAAVGLAWEPARVAPADGGLDYARRAVLLLGGDGDAEAGRPDRAQLRAAVRVALTVAPLPLRTTGSRGVSAGQAVAFDSGQRAALAGVATAVGLALAPGRAGRVGVTGGGGGR